MNWHTKPATMVEKVTKVRALREAFVDDLSGMYEQDEMGVELPTDNIINVAPEDFEQREPQTSESETNETLETI